MDHITTYNAQVENDYDFITLPLCVNIILHIIIMHTLYYTYIYVMAIKLVYIWIGAESIYFILYYIGLYML